MISALAIRDFALIRSLDLKLEAGLTVITGETGAGKSMVFDALGLLTGERADSNVIRSGAERAEVSAEIQLALLQPARRQRIQSWLSEFELHDSDDQNLLHLRRVIRAEGASRAWINGKSVSVSQLKQVLSQLVEIHGQHDSQLLQEKALQLELLDQALALEAQAEQCADRAQAVRLANTRCAEIRALSGTDGDIVSLLRDQLAELKQLNLAPDYLENLDQQQRRMANADALLQGLNLVCERLDGDSGVLRSLSQGYAEMQKLAGLDARLADVCALLDSAIIEVREAAHLALNAREQLDLDPQSLAKIEAELARLFDAARKFRVPRTQLAMKRDELATRLQAFSDSQGALDRALAELAQANVQWRESAEALSAARRTGAIKLGRRVAELLQQLGMVGAVLDIAFEAREAQDASPHGLDSVEFMLAPNSGVPAKALRKIASGGELSRIALALKLASIERRLQAPSPKHKKSLPTGLIRACMAFDEVDAGIGGAVAQTVGELLQALSRGNQVLVVTHLAQIAACADQHLYVSKSAKAQQTDVTWATLDEAARENELARMLGGQITERTLATAREMRARGLAVNAQNSV